MKIYRDYRGQSIRLTEERRKHILEHPEMKSLMSRIEETLSDPQRVVQSLSDRDVNLYYKYYLGTKVGDKYLCVVVKLIKKEGGIVVTLSPMFIVLTLFEP